MNSFKNSKLWKRLLAALLFLPIAIFAIALFVVYRNQDSIVQHLIETLNKDFRGSIEMQDSHISFFENFPYISIDLEHVKVYENKEKNTTPIVDVQDAYIGFDLVAILSGNMQIKKIKLNKGSFNIIQHIDGEFNILKALSTEKEIENAEEEFHLDIHEIEFEQIDLTKLNEADSLLADVFITSADAKFKTADNEIVAALESKFELSLINKGDTTFIKHKHFEAATKIHFLQATQFLKIEPTTLKLEGAEFNLEGSVDFVNDMLLDLKFSGNKENFELFIAMAPDELIPVLKRYENQGKIFFEATVQGKSINGNMPAINAKFGCENAFFNNYSVNKKLSNLNFAGTFTNGEKRDLSTMELNIKDFSAKPEAGIFSGKLNVKNFASPEINLQLKSEFELDFLAKFLNLEGLTDLAGKVSLTMNFRDIIDLEFPERSIEKLNESYFTQLKIENLNFKSDAFHLPVKNINLYAEMNGHEAHIDYFNFSAGKSDISMSGSISDLPAVIHHTAIPVTTKLNIKSNFLDLHELSAVDTIKGVDEQIENLSLDLEFNSTARAFTESPNLPVGEFFIKNLYAKLKHYPHTLHDFHADVIVEKEDFRVIDFKGVIDKSDFFFSGKLKHYDLWFAEHPKGDTKIEFNLTSNLLQLEDVFSYKGENYVPEDYRHEEFRNFKLHGYTDLHFNEGLKSVDFYLDDFDAKMKIHPLAFRDFNGRIHYENEHLVVENFSGKLGKSDFKTTVHYYLGKDETVKKRDNHFSLSSTRLDFDELFNYNPPPISETTTTNHDSVFNIYSLPFTDMTFDVNIGHLNYHRYLLDNVKAKLHTTPNHYLYIDTAHLEAAGGSFDLSGYFNGSNPELIYFSPNLKVKGVDLDKLLFKFENFGQDHLVSENLHGRINAGITGKIHIHTDLVPKIDDSEIRLDLQVLNGRLENYKLLNCVSDYFSDKNLKIVSFDTLANHIDLTKGVLTVPKMTINSSLGFLEISGKQDVNFNMEYYLSVPWKMVTQAASSKLFGKKTEEVDPEQVDAIQYADPQKKTRFLNLKITGNSDNYQVALGKNKNTAKNK